MDIEEELRTTVREGRLKKVEQLLFNLDTRLSCDLLCVAIESRHKEITKLIIDFDHDILCEDFYSPYGNLFHMAVENNDIKLLKTFLIRDSYVSKKDCFLCTPFQVAVSNGNKDIIKILLRHYIDIKSKDILNTTAIEYAIIEGKTEILDLVTNSYAELQGIDMPLPETLIKQVADVNYIIDGLTCIHLAALRGYVKIVERLIQYGVPINSVSTAEFYDGYTALHFACEKQRYGVVQLLLSNDANVDAVSKKNVTPLLVAAGMGDEKIVKILLDHGANVDAQDVNGKSVLRAAAEKGYSSAVDCILSYDPDVNNESNRSALITALHGYGNKYKQVVCSLVSYGFTNKPEELTDATFLIAGIEKDNVKLVEKHLLCDTEPISSFINDLFREDQTLLHLACENGGGEVVNFFLQNGADVNAVTNEMLSPLLVATKAGNEKAVKELLQYGANVNDQDKYGKTVLYLAAEKGYLLIVDHILRHHPDVNNECNRKALRAAILSSSKSYKFCDKYRANINVIDHFFQCGFGIGVEDVVDNKILQAAIMKGYVNVVEYFLKYGAYVNMSNLTASCCTPLHYAAKFKQKDVALLLIKYGAEVNAKDNTGKTPIFYAVCSTVELTDEIENIDEYTELEIDFNMLSDIVKNECTKCNEMIELLLQFGGRIDSSDNAGTCALHRLASSETILYDSELAGIAELLLRKGANFNAQDQNGSTPLHVSVEGNNKLLMKMLLKYGAVINLNQKNDIELLHNAVYNNNLKFVKYLLKLGIDVNSVNESNNTPLYIASEKGYKQLVLTLLDYGADVNIMAKYSETALERAMHGTSLYYCRNCPNNYLCEDVFNILRQYIVQLNCANLYVNKRDLEDLTSQVDFHMGYTNDVDKEIIDFQERCYKELKIMSDEVVDSSNFSLYDILTFDVTKLSTLVRNEDIMQALSTCDYKTKFPVYSRMMTSHIRRAIEKTKLMEQSINFFHVFYNNLPRLPDDCVEIILSYLTESELKFLIANSLEFDEVLNLLLHL